MRLHKVIYVNQITNDIRNTGGYVFHSNMIEKFSKYSIKHKSNLKHYRGGFVRNCSGDIIFVEREFVVSQMLLSSDSSKCNFSYLVNNVFS